MAFGQANGYPATRSQMEQLSELILGAGHTDFRDARGPLGLTQRQAGGKFTRDEADEMIARLEAEAEGADPAGVAEPAEMTRATMPKSDTARKAGQPTAGLARIASEKLAAELQRRGWVVLEP